VHNEPAIAFWREPTIDFRMSSWARLRTCCFLTTSAADVGPRCGADTHVRETANPISSHALATKRFALSN